MEPTFGDQLKLFALSVDIIETDRFNHVCSLIEKYCKDTLDIQYTKLHLASDIDGQRGLRRYPLGSSTVENVMPVKNVNGHYNSQTALAYDKAKPLWVVSFQGEKTLDRCQKYIDHWSNLRTLPTYRSTSESNIHGIRTSIVVPIPDDKIVLGVINFRTEKHIEITTDAKNELLKVAEAIGMLIKLRRFADSQKLNTEAALDHLNEVLLRPQPKLTKPKIFLASSSRANPDVINLVKSVLGEDTYKKYLDLVYWKAMDKPGNINQQLLEAISECRYGICYFSQNVAENIYEDNINVVFEAGMFHGRVDGLSSSPSSWIPIREHQSPELPFDFASERILWVPRSKLGNLNERSFASNLRKTLNSFLQIT